MQKRLIVKGRVQDVDYRETVKDIARLMNVFGEVRNLKNGTVEILCGCNDKKHFEEFKDKITIKEQSHYKPFVEKIDEYPEDINLNVFTVDYDDVQTQLLKKTIIGSKAMKDMVKQMNSMNENLGNKMDDMNENLGNKIESGNKDIGNKMDSMNTEMKLMNNNLGNKIDSLNINITNRFDTMEQKYDTIGKTMIKLEQHFGKLVEEFIEKKKKK